MSIYQKFTTSQTGVHDKLEELVKKYANSKYDRPIPETQKLIFEQIVDFAKKLNKPLILDSCCGTGFSSYKLALKNFSQHGVIGIDKSIARLERGINSGYNKIDNLILVRGDVLDLWRLLASSDLTIDRHYILFPNPWPKFSQLKRRFHAHPVFKTMVNMAPYLELRTNWRIYAEEHAQALKLLGHTAIIEQSQQAKQEYLTLFEKKYLESNTPIYTVIKR